MTADQHHLIGVRYAPSRRIQILDVIATSEGQAQDAARRHVMESTGYDDVSFFGPVDRNASAHAYIDATE